MDKDFHLVNARCKVPEPLWRKLKAEASLVGRHTQDLVAVAIKEYLVSKGSEKEGSTKDAGVSDE